MRKKLFLVLSLTALSTLRSQNIINTMAGNGAAGYGGDGSSAIAATLNHPVGITADRLGNIYIADYLNNRVRKINTAGIITTVAGTGTAGFSGDGGPAIAAKLNGPWGLGLDTSGNLYITEYFNHRIRKVSTLGVITTVAGKGTAGYNGDGGKADTTQFNSPTAVAIDKTGNIYVADYSNNRVRKINVAGFVSTIAGTGTAGYSGDGAQATLAKLASPSSVIVNKIGTIFISEIGNNTIRKIDMTGVITTIAGTGTAGFSGDGGQAKSAALKFPYGMAIDTAGKMFVADFGNNRIRMIDAAGVITSIAGNGVAAFSGDGGAPLLASLDGPIGIAFDTPGRLYIADEVNERIRRITFNTGTTSIGQSVNNISVNIYPNPSEGNFSINTSQIIDEIKIIDVIGNVVYFAKPNSQKINLVLENAGIYFVSIACGKESTVRKIIVNR